MRQYWLLALMASLWVSPLLNAATWTITYPRQMSELDYRSEYPVKVLSAALAKTGVNYDLLPSDQILFQADAIRALKANRTINIMWSMTDQQREDTMRPIRIPLYKGLFGTRLLIIKPSNRHFFDDIDSLEGLSQFRAVSGQDWPDTKILQANGINVVTDPDYERLFDVLKNDRGIMFPRSALEIYQELQESKEKYGFMVEPNLALYYPTAVYFFVNENNITLYHLVKSGMEQLIDSGEFDRLFEDYHQALLDKANLGERRILRLDNPIIPEETPLERHELWHRAAQE